MSLPVCSASGEVFFFKGYILNDLCTPDGGAQTCHADAAARDSPIVPAGTCASTSARGDAGPDQTRQSLVLLQSDGMCFSIKQSVLLKSQKIMIRWLLVHLLHSTAHVGEPYT
jgi:hypothetical protein